MTLPPRKLNAGRVCQAEGCDEQVYQRDYCQIHYGRWWRHGDPLVRLKFPGDTKPRCSVEGCERKAIAGGVCKGHYYERWKAARPECSIDGCDIPAASRGLCPRHYQRWKKYGDPVAGPAFRRRRGTGLPDWVYWQRRGEQKLARDQDMIDWGEILRCDPCSYCGRPCEQIDHIVPFDAGGKLTPENTTAACASCNHRKSHTPLLQFLLLR